jgi:hypothetical protein
MKNLFKKNKIAIENLLKDSIDHLVDQFRQARTNFTVASAYGQIILVLQNITQLILLYIEDSITELNITQASRPTSVQGLLRLTGHNPTRAISATGEIALSVLGGQEVPGGVIIIPNHTKIKCLNNGVTYILDLPGDEIRLPIDGSKNGMKVNIIQGEMEQQIFTGTGQQLQSIEVNFPQSTYIDHYKVDVFVNGERWRPYDSLYDMPKDGKCYLLKTGMTSGVDIFFGNSYFGALPPLGAEIRVEYLVTGGDIGNIDATEDKVYFKWEEPGFDLFGDDIEINDMLIVKSTIAPEFGTNPEPLSLSRLIAPKTSRSYVLANPDNYIIFLEKFNLFSIIDAYITDDDDNIEDDNVIYLFLIPNVTKKLKSSENYFDLDESEFKLTDNQKKKVLNLIEKSGSKVISTEISIVDPKITRYVINVALIIFETGPSEDMIRQSITEKISDYFLSVRRRDRIPRSDLIAIIESVAGVDSVNINIVSEANEYMQSLAKSKGVNMPLEGIDEFGDIIIEAGELPIIRGGWSDRNGVSYVKGIDEEKPCSINIQIRDTVPYNYNTEINSRSKNNIKK